MLKNNLKKSVGEIPADILLSVVEHAVRKMQYKVYKTAAILKQI